MDGFELVRAQEAQFVGLDVRGAFSLVLPARIVVTTVQSLLFNNKYQRLFSPTDFDICHVAKEEGQLAGLDFLTVSSVNPGGYWCGENTGATPDGRRAGKPMAIGLSPSSGCDVGGMTAMMKSLAKVNPANGGVASNIKISKRIFDAQRDKLEGLFSTFFDMGGLQASVTVVDQNDLLEAKLHPERHRNLLVRIGGWSGRFVDQTPKVQEDIIKRSVY